MATLNELNEATLSLIVQLLSTHIEQKQAILDDLKVTRDHLNADLTQMRQKASDDQTARNLAQDLSESIDDRDLQNEEIPIESEEIASQDRQTTNPSVQDRHPPDREEQQDSDATTRNETEVIKTPSIPHTPVESATTGQEPEAESTEELVTCDTCSLEMRSSDAAHAPCEHIYCQGCLTMLVQASMADETLFPPRCCLQSITFKVARPFLDPDTADDFFNKSLLTTPYGTYCSNCWFYIPPSEIDVENKTGTCLNCHNETCTECKSGKHEGECFEEFLHDE